jgi:monofunctional biosynthetic peptidoglycan transglycosylase
VLRLLGRVVLVALAFAFGTAAYVYLTVPNVRVLRTENPSTTAFIELRAREARIRGDTPRRVQRWVSYARISPSLKRAVLVAEDSGFWQHEGIDFQQIKESMEINIERMEFARGASTITQQLAKNLYLSPSKNPIRKIRELLIARRLEAELTKQRILELYLNVIEWGDGIYGAEAAARTYFRKPAAELGPEEAALLAAAIINPRLLDPAHPSARLRRRQRMILRRMGLVTPPPVVTEAAAPTALEPVPPLPPSLTIPASGPPPVLPGEVVPPVKGSGGKPPGGPETPFKDGSVRTACATYDLVSPCRLCY